MLGALAALRNAISALVEADDNGGGDPVVDKTDLLSEIAAGGELDESDYTPESWAAFVAARDAAALVVADADATQEQVDGVLSALRQAVDALVLADDDQGEVPGTDPGTDPGADPGTDSGADDRANDSDELGDLPRTGATTSQWVLILVALLLVGGSLLLVARRESVIKN